MWNDLHDHEWGGLPLMDNQAIPAGGVCGAFTVEATRVAASDQVLDANGKPVSKGDKLDDPASGGGTVLDVFTDDPDGEVYVEWGDGTKTVVWGSEVRVASRRTAGDDDDEDDKNNDHIRARDTERCPGCGRQRPIDGNCPRCEMADETGDTSELPNFTYEASRRTAALFTSPDYKEAFQWAQDKANEYGKDMGIEKSGYDNLFLVSFLPDEANSYGYDMRKERVKPMQVGASRHVAISGDVAGEEVSDAREDDARVMESARLTEADSAYIMAGVATKHGDLGTFVRSASRNPAVYLRQAVYDAHGFMPTVREAMALWKWTANRVPIEEAAI